MRIIKTLAMFVAPLLSFLGVDFLISNLIKAGKLKFSKESEKKYTEIESEYKQKLISWAKKRGINIKNPNRREKDLLKKELEIVESEALDKFIDYLKANRRKRDIKILLIGTEFVKIVNEHIKNRL